jgi:O-antigen/teichoic acid export membrane protein
MSFKRSIFQSVKAAGLSAFATNFLLLLQWIVLARLLEPADFGLMSMLTVVLGLLSIIAELGIPGAIIHRQNIDQADLATLYWFSLLVGVLLFGFTVMLTPFAVRVYGELRLERLIFWGSLVLLIVPIGQQHQALMEKQLQFGELARIEVISGSLSLLVAVYSALNGYGALSLVWGFLVNAVAKSILYVLAGWNMWRPSFVFLGGALRQHWNFGLHYVGQRLVNYVQGSIDFALIGAFIGAEALGAYTLAYNLANLPSSKINAVLSRVFFPVLSYLQKDLQALRKGYLQLQEATSMVNIPFSVAMAAAAPVAIPLWFGHQWQTSVLLLQILCVVGVGRAISGTIGPLLLASGRTDLGFRWSLLIVSLQVPGIYVGVVSKSAVGVAIAFAILQIVYVILNYMILVRTLIGPCLRAYIGKMWPFIWMSLAMGVMMIVVAHALSFAGNGVVFFSEIVIGASVYAGLMWLVKKPFLLELSALSLGKDLREYRATIA